MIKDIAQKALKEKRKIRIFAHQRPDADALSSSLALRKYFKSKGIDAEYVIDNEIRYFYQGLLGDVEVFKEEVTDNDISVICDTSTVDFGQNQLFKNSKKENTFVIDHHEKPEGQICIEDELELSPENVIREPKTSSASEIIAKDLAKDNELSPEVATDLILGLLGDTASLRYLQKDTLNNLNMIMENGGDYQKVLEKTGYKTPLQSAVGMAKILKDTNLITLDNGLKIAYVNLSNDQYKFFAKYYKLGAPHKQIFKMSNIEDCCATMFCAETSLGNNEIEFRSTPNFGNVNVQQIAANHNGGGHLNASGCTYKTDKTFKDASREIVSELAKTCNDQTKDYVPLTLNAKDDQIIEILKSTNYLKTNIDKETLLKLQELNNDPESHYQYVYDEKRTINDYLLEYEILAKVPYKDINNKNVEITITPQDMAYFKKKFDVTEKDLYKHIELFTKNNIDFEYATINFPENSVSIDNEGNITKYKKIEDEPPTI